MNIPYLPQLKEAAACHTSNMGREGQLTVNDNSKQLDGFRQFDLNFTYLDDFCIDFTQLLLCTQQDELCFLCI